jgi:signal peptidase II
MLAAAGIAAGVTLVVDQASKAMVRATMEPGERHDLTGGGAVALRHVQNHGSAYGLVGHMPAWVPAIGTAAIGAGMLALGARSPKAGMIGVGAGMLIGGGIGNVVDRLHQGHVTDFIDGPVRHVQRRRRRCDGRPGRGRRRPHLRSLIRAVVLIPVS